MDKQIYITEEEREKCQKVVDAFAELYEMENIVVIDAGRYGFVKLKYYKPPKMQPLPIAGHYLRNYGESGEIQSCICLQKILHC